MWAGGIVGPYFFKNEVGRNVDANGATITDYSLPEIEARDLRDVWFQRDGATCHAAREPMALPRERLGEQIISRFGPANRSPRSCDTTRLDFSLWGHVKSKFYTDKPATIQSLEANVTRVIGRIPIETLERAVDNRNVRMDNVSRSYGRHLNEIVFEN